MRATTRWIVAAAAALLFMTATVALAQEEEQQDLAEYVNRPVIGTNLAGNADWSTQYPWADLMKQSRPWQLAPGKFLETVKPDGYPTSIGDAHPYATVVLSAHHPAGVYVLTWKGTAKLSVPKYDVVRVVKQEANRLEVEVAPKQGLYVQIDSMDPNNPITDLHFWLPDHEGKLFNKAFLDYIRPFGTLRFMDLMATNGSIQQAWEKRPKPENLTWRLKESTGVPVEVLVALANEAKTDPWFCMPHLADDDYMRQFATYVRDNLDPELKAYIEYSNEVWNWSFAATHYALKLGKEMGYEQGKGPQHAYYAKRAVEMFKIWEDVYGGTDRIVRVLGGWSSNMRATQMVIEYADAKNTADALAVAPYFGFNNEILRGDWGKMETVEQVLDLAEKVVREHVKKMVADNKALADNYGLDLIAYEAGQHLLSRTERNNPQGGPQTTLFIAANRHPRMAELYKLYLQTWFENGGGVICMFSSIGGFGRYGSWGMSEYLGQPLDQAHKYRAVLQAIEDEDLAKEARAAAAE